MNDDLTDIKVTLARIEVHVEQNKESLIEHMEQTRLLKQDMNNRLSPIEKHITGVAFLLTCAKWLGLPLIGSCVTIVIKYIKGI